MEQTLIFAQTPDLDYMTSQIASYLTDDDFLVVRHHRQLFMGIAVEGLTIDGPTFNKTDGVKALIDHHMTAFGHKPNTATVDKNEVTLKTHVDAVDYFTLTPRKHLKKG